MQITLGTIELDKLKQCIRQRGLRVHDGKTGPVVEWLQRNGLLVRHWTSGRETLYVPTKKGRLAVRRAGQ